MRKNSQDRYFIVWMASTIFLREIFPGDVSIAKSAEEAYLSETRVEETRRRIEVFCWASYSRWRSWNERHNNVISSINSGNSLKKRLSEYASDWFIGDEIVWTIKRKVLVWQIVEWEKNNSHATRYLFCPSWEQIRIIVKNDYSIGRHLTITFEKYSSNENIYFYYSNFNWCSVRYLPTCGSANK